MTTSKCKHCGRKIYKFSSSHIWHHEKIESCYPAEPIDETEKAVERAIISKNVFNVNDAQKSIVSDLQSLIEKFILEYPSLWVDQIEIMHMEDRSGKKVLPKIKVTIEVN